MGLILASSSAIRLQILQAAALEVTPLAPRVDEAAIRAALLAEGAPPRDIADALAEAKARKIGEKRPEDVVLGCDQILACDGEIYAKPATHDEAAAQLHRLRGKTHHLYSALVVYEDARPVWRHLGEVRLTMHQLSDSYIHAYVARNWHSIRHSVGGYKIEEEGIRLFSAVDGDHFTILGLPILPLLAWLGTRGMIDR